MGETPTGDERLRVKPEEPLADMVRKAGLEWSLDVIDALNEKRYVESPEGGPNLPYETMPLAKERTSEEALALLRERGLSPVDVKELVAYAAKHPESGGTVIALGTRVAHRGALRVFVLEGRKLTFVEDRSEATKTVWPADAVVLGVKREVA